MVMKPSPKVFPSVFDSIYDNFERNSHFLFQCVLGSDGGTPSVDLPVGTTAKQLELLINSLLANPESVRNLRNYAISESEQLLIFVDHDLLLLDQQVRQLFNCSGFK